MEKIFEDFLDNVQIDDEELQDDIDGAEIQYEYRLEFDVIMNWYINSETVETMTKELLRFQRKLTVMLERCPQITHFSKPVFYDSNVYQHVVRHEEEKLKHYDLDGVDIVGMKAEDIFHADIDRILYGVVTFNGDFDNACSVMNFIKYFVYRIFTISCNRV